MRLFVAIWPPAELAAALTRVELPRVSASRTGSGLRRVRAEQMHVTLVFLGDVDPASAARRLETVDPVPHGGTVAELGATVGAFGRSVLYVPVTGLDALAGAVRAACADLAVDDRPFTGHLTLARAQGRGNVRPRAGAPVPTAGTAWPVAEVTLVASVSGPEGHAYETLSSLALPAA